jgi:hypothetical protein
MSFMKPLSIGAPAPWARISVDGASAAWPVGASQIQPCSCAVIGRSLRRVLFAHAGLFYQNIDHPPTEASTTAGIMQQRRRPMTLPAVRPAPTARVQLPGVSLARHFGNEHRILSAPTCTQPGGFIDGICFLSAPDDHP